MLGYSFLVVHQVTYSNATLLISLLNYTHLYLRSHNNVS